MWEDLYDASLQEKKNFNQQLVKLMEEVGELAEASLIDEKAPGLLYKKNKEEAVLEEGSDVLIMAYCILIQRGYSYDQIHNKMSQKIGKWRKNMEKEWI